MEISIQSEIFIIDSQSKVSISSIECLIYIISSLFSKYLSIDQFFPYYIILSINQSFNTIFRSQVASDNLSSRKAMQRNSAYNTRVLKQADELQITHILLA